jgi:hypothetical protein
MQIRPLVYIRSPARSTGSEFSIMPRRRGLRWRPIGPRGRRQHSGIRILAPRTKLYSKRDARESDRFWAGNYGAKWWKPGRRWSFRSTGATQSHFAAHSVCFHPGAFPFLIFLSALIFLVHGREFSDRRRWSYFASGVNTQRELLHQAEFRSLALGASGCVCDLLSATVCCWVRSAPDWIIAVLTWATRNATRFHSKGCVRPRCVWWFGIFLLYVQRAKCFIAPSS